MSAHYTFTKAATRVIHIVTEDHPNGLCGRMGKVLPENDPDALEGRTMVTSDDGLVCTFCALAAAKLLGWNKSYTYYLPHTIRVCSHPDCGAEILGAHGHYEIRTQEDKHANQH